MYFNHCNSVVAEETRTASVEFEERLYVGSIVIRSLARMNNHVRLQVTNKIVPPDIASATLRAHETASFTCVFQFVVFVPAASPDNAEWSAGLAEDGSKDMLRALG